MDHPIDIVRRFCAAWSDNADVAELAAFFSEDATYSYYPFDEPVRGRLAIVASWQEGKDPAGTYEADHKPIAIDGSLGVAQGSRYFKDPSKAELVREYDNIFLIEFDDHRRCRSFREWYMRPRGQKEPS